MQVCTLQTGLKLVTSTASNRELPSVEPRSVELVREMHNASERLKPPRKWPQQRTTIRAECGLAWINYSEPTLGTRIDKQLSLTSEMSLLPDHENAAAEAAGFKDVMRRRSWYAEWIRSARLQLRYWHRQRKFLSTLWLMWPAWSSAILTPRTDTPAFAGVCSNGARRVCTDFGILFNRCAASRARLAET